MEHAFDVALILHADHELNASTFAARVTAATLSDIYSCVDLGHRRSERTAARRRQRRSDQVLLEVGTAEKAVERVHEHAGAARSRSRASAIASTARKIRAPRTCACMSEELGKSTGHEDLYLMSKRVEETVKRREEAQPERGFLLRLHLLFAGHSDRSVHADFRRQPHVRLDRARAGAVPQQPPDPPARRIQRQPGRHAVDSDGTRTITVDERAYYTESQTTKPATLNCPSCRTQDTYELNWIVRKKKDRLPGGADERDRAKFAKAQSYMVLLDNQVDVQEPALPQALRYLRRQDDGVPVAEGFFNAEHRAENCKSLFLCALAVSC